MKKAIFSIFYLIMFLSVRAQLLDDSTVLVYGPATVQVIYENDLLFNLEETHAIDTSVQFLHRWDYYTRDQRFYQDLGNNGTARMPVFFQLPSIIGRTSGLNAYDHLLVQPAEFKYYDTKSPYMIVDAVLGGVGRSLAGLSYTQNIKPNWNFGFTFHRLVSDKQIGAVTTQFDRNVVSTVMTAHTYFDHGKIPYKLLFNVSRLNHNVAETGGVFGTDSTLTSQLFQYTESAINLREATGNELRLNWHLYHEYGLFKEFELYHQLDYNNQDFKYKDRLDVNQPSGYNPYRDFYRQFLISADTTSENTSFKVLSNEVGIKGNISSVYYRFYARNRIIDQSNTHANPFPTFTEGYLGAISQFRWKDAFTVNAQAEFTQSGEYLLIGSIQSKLLTASYTSMRYAQSLLSQRYSGNHHDWNNNFTQGFANEIKAVLNAEFKFLKLSPEARFTTINNLVYFDALSSPQINSSALLLSQIGGNINFSVFTNQLKKEAFKLDQFVMLTNVSGRNSQVMPVPALFYNARMYWDGTWFSDAVPVQWGVEFHTRSAYYANTYQPDIQQFYLQNNLQIESYFVADLFVNMRIDKIFVFLKYNHINQPADNGYFVTPFYPGLGRIFDFGVKWLFFD